MTRSKWKNRIKKACVAADTYKNCFDDAIDTLAGILERRDQAEALFYENSELIVEHTNKGGATNRELNPLVRLINELNRDALAYWKELGLTPNGLKRINEAAMKEQAKTSALEKALLKMA